MSSMPHASVAAATQGEGSADRAAAEQVLKIEADALIALAASLNGDFDRALDVLEGVTNRIVVTGIGKSGHVARKIAATLASTGSPSFYVHPSEASHGDLGMLSRGDAVLALSNSGNTAELADIVGHVRRFTIPLIGITSNGQSTLAEQSDVALLLPRAPEACPHGLAPTTSTTLMLALGDAIAIALLQRRGFTQDDFRVLHPGGNLGRRLLKVSDIMHTGETIPLAPADLPLGETILAISAGSFGCVGIVDGAGRLEGIITDGDLRRHIHEAFENKTAGTIMTRKPRTIRPGALAAEALGVMNERAITSLFVTDETGRPLGIVHIHDCLRAGVAMG